MVTSNTNETEFLTETSAKIQASSPPPALTELVGMIKPDEYIGDLIKLDYDHADVLVHDTRKIQLNGVPHGCLLVASRITPETPDITDPRDRRASLLLLRVIGSARLNSDIDLDRTRFEIVQRSNDTFQNYDDAKQTDQFTLNLLRYAGIQCRILGTFRLTPSDDESDWRVHFGADIDNFYAGQGMKIYKPTGDVLEKIVNYRDEMARKHTSSRIGRLRYSAAIKESDTQDSVPIEIVAEDFIAQRTALFGMTRTGKSNATKTIASALFSLRRASNGIRVGQLIFDPNGEYANDNPQDQGCIRNLKHLDDGRFLDDVHTYGLYDHPYDEGRHITKFNFYGDPEPVQPSSGVELEKALWTLYKGKEIIDDALSEETSGYVTAFRNAEFDASLAMTDRGEYTRFRRRIFVYRGILADIGFPYQGRADVKGLFSQEIRKLMNESDHMRSFVNALDAGRMSWEVAGNFTRAFAEWVDTPQFRNFDSRYASKNDGRNWSDSHLLGLLKFHANTRARPIAQNTRDWHDLDSHADYAETIVEQVRDGKLVIVDQLLGNPEMNAQAAERIVRRLFEAQQYSFSHPQQDRQTGEIIKPPPVIVYVEEAHNLLPRANEDDTTKIWTRLAKEGAKFNIGMVYSTQEPSSIQTNILKNTENWFIAHLNNTDETNQIRKFNDFDDFKNSIVNVAEPGFLKVRTRSSYFTVSVQMDLFEALTPMSATLDQDTGGDNGYRASSPQ